MATGESFKDTKKNKIYLWLYEVFTSLGQWFINHCDMESYELTQAKWAEMIDGIRVKSEFTTKGERNEEI